MLNQLRLLQFKAEASGQYYQTFLGIIYATSSIFPYDFDWGYTDYIFFISLTPAANVIKLFWPNYVAIGVTSVKIIGKYTAGGITYAFKKFYNIGHRAQCNKTFKSVIYGFSKYARVVVPGRLLQTSLMFAGKA